MTLNDTYLNGHVTEILLEAKKLEQLVRDRKLRALADSLAKIHNASRQAEWRVMQIMDELQVPDDTVQHSER